MSIKEMGTKDSLLDGYLAETRIVIGSAEATINEEVTIARGNNSLIDYYCHIGDVLLDQFGMNTGQVMGLFNSLPIKE